MTTLTEPSARSLLGELNVLGYLQALRQRWLLIVAFVIVGAALGFGVSMLLPRVYRAHTELAIVRTGTLINFDPKFRTVSDNDPNAQALDQVSRRRSLVTIGSSASFAALVIERIGQQLPEDLREPFALQQLVDIDNDGDIIGISTVTDSPELSSLIANTWAQVYFERVNATFSENSLSTDLLLTQVTEAKANFDAREGTLVEYLRNNPYEALVRQQTLVSRQLNGQVDFEGKLSLLEIDARSLRDQLSRGSGNVSTADLLSRLLLQVHTFNSLGDAPLQLDLPVVDLGGETSRPQQIEQLDGLIKTIQDRRAALGGATRDELLKQLNSIQAQIEQAQSQRKELEAARDLAWGTYQLLNNKVAENNVASQTQSELVRIASPAVTPTRPVDTRRTLNTLLGAAAGLVLGAAVALVLRAR